MIESYFSNTYSEARSRFMNAASMAGAEIISYPVGINLELDLALDVAILGKECERTIIVSSGVHGVEGFFGSAVQLALLERLREESTEHNVRYVLIHGVNPYGFSHLRRVNEDNIDLNRNFQINAKDYAGVPSGYIELNGFLNPDSPPSRFEPFKLKALWNIRQYGLQKLKQAVAGGQYRYPRGLFYGGNGPSESARIVQDNCDSWISDSENILHIDLHTGLGAFGTYKLLLTEASGSNNHRWYSEAFGEDCVEYNTQTDRTFNTENDSIAYSVSGSFGDWMQHHFSKSKYRFVTAEFGTYSVIRVLGAIRADNRAHFYASENRESYQWVKNELLECFCPKNSSWRRKVIESAIGIVDQGIKALLINHT